MTRQELQLMASQGRVQELNLLSHEGAMYFVEAVVDDQRHLLKAVQTDTRPQTFRSLEQVRRTLCEVPLESICLVHLNVCDEMGPVVAEAAPGGAAMRLSVPLRP